jgi:hypothetical protein
MTDKNAITDPFGAEDMGAVERALAVVRDFDMQGVQVVHHALPVVLAEFDRIRKKLSDIADGKTTMYLSDADRAVPTQQLSDASLLVWTRATLAFLEQATTKIANERADASSAEQRGIEKLTAMHGVVSLAAMAIRANAGKLTYRVGGITDKDRELGDWTVTLEKDDPDAPGYVIIVSANAEGDSSYGVITKENYDRWNIGEVYPDIDDLFGLMFDGAPDLVDTFVTWPDALRLIDEADGKLVDVVGTIAY